MVGASDVRHWQGKAYDIVFKCKRVAWRHAVPVDGCLRARLCLGDSNSLESVYAENETCDSTSSFITLEQYQPSSVLQHNCS